MLVLSRKPKESITFHVPGVAPIKFTVVEVSGQKVRLGFDAPREVTIMRSELEEKESK